MRLARTFSPPGGALGAPQHDVQSILSCGVPMDHVETVMKLLLVKKLAFHDHTLIVCIGRIDIMSRQ